MRITTKTNIAIRALMFCAVNTGRTVQKAQIACACNASENHLAQVINALAQKGYIHTHRGRSGGMELAREAEEISIGEVFRDLEVGTPFAECFSDTRNTCPLTKCCRLRIALERALSAFYHELDTITLGDLVAGNVPLQAILGLDAGSNGPCPQRPAPA